MKIYKLEILNPPAGFPVEEYVDLESIQSISGVWNSGMPTYYAFTIRFCLNPKDLIVEVGYCTFEKESQTRALELIKDAHYDLLQAWKCQR